MLVYVYRHGLARTDYHILYDSKLAFREIVMAKMAQAKAANAAAGYPSSMAVPQAWPGESGNIAIRCVLISLP